MWGKAYSKPPPSGWSSDLPQPWRQQEVSGSLATGPDASGTPSRSLAPLPPRRTLSTLGQLHAMPAGCSWEGTHLPGRGRWSPGTQPHQAVLEGLDCSLTLAGVTGTSGDIAPETQGCPRPHCVPKVRASTCAFLWTVLAAHSPHHLPQPGECVWAGSEGPGMVQWPSYS